MGCGCKKKEDLDYVIGMATKMAINDRRDYQIYSYKNYDGRIFYEFEPINSSRESILCYIPYLHFSHSEP